ncbi:hypothetical protein CERSUDRAFT_105141 [Gelatoporia subvermispora B]|uniref:Vacuolar import and degradation protein n=1 Tax=Ceriporiopsis subvermispora (strain B) TaxID=914234 RepID=M2PPV6_CERS8|nr:hypothetical protein CERSUDRAFT_105141 [Gelatoporia subvermispora B]
MPAEHPPPAAHDQSSPDPPPPQHKYCAACHSTLPLDSVFILHGASAVADNSIVCASCRARLSASRTDRDGFFVEVERELLRRAASLPAAGTETPSQPPALVADSKRTSVDSSASSDEEMSVESSAPAPSTSTIPLSDCAPPSTPSAHTTTPFAPTTASTRPSLTPLTTNGAQSYSLIRTTHPSQPVATSSAVASSSRPQPQRPAGSSPDPLIDITRLRVRSQGHHCLYPGASFQGTQKSGRNSYDVNVTIVDVDFSSSHLCGYLRIRGLTDDWPELTTYFDAEIIGSRYGFLTRNWGASEQEDMVHWARFPAFRHVKHELKKPHLTMKDADRGAVFMRWKEKFLVPDHRVQDINGASFAGFYYVCVDFNPQQSGSQPLASPTEAPIDEFPQSTLAQSPMVTKPEPVTRSRRMSSGHGFGHRRSGRSSSRGLPSSNVATMSGFYYHQNSEPYQQLSLVHVPEHTTSCFEFR